MMELKSTVFNPRGWEVISGTVCGSSHGRSGTPNQDAVYWRSSAGTGEENIVCVAVADGHGGNKYIRSSLGSMFAVRETVDVLEHFAREMLSNPESRSSGSSISRIAQETLPRSVTRRWDIAVRSHFHSQDFTENEFENLTEQQRAELRARPQIAYGSTVLGTVVTDVFILYLQLGDGDILTVTETGEVSSPLIDDPRAFANETPSLCNGNAWQDFRILYQPTDDHLPALIVLTTDGYRNSYGTRDGFSFVGSDILRELLLSGPPQIAEAIPIFLKTTTENGSGDDITIANVFRTELFFQRTETGEKDHSVPPVDSQLGDRDDRLSPDNNLHNNESEPIAADPEDMTEIVFTPTE